MTHFFHFNSFGPWQFIFATTMRLLVRTVFFSQVIAVFCVHKIPSVSTIPHVIGRPPEALDSILFWVFFGPKTVFLRIQWLVYVSCFYIFPFRKANDPVCLRRARPRRSRSPTPSTLSLPRTRCPSPRVRSTPSPGGVGLSGSNSPHRTIHHPNSHPINSALRFPGRLSSLAQFSSAYRSSSVIIIPPTAPPTPSGR